MNLTPEEAWDKYSARVNAAVAAVQYGDPTTDKDNKAAAMNWVEREAFLEAWRIILEILADDATPSGV